MRLAIGALTSEIGTAEARARLARMCSDRDEAAEIRAGALRDALSMFLTAAST